MSTSGYSYSLVSDAGLVNRGCGGLVLLDADQEGDLFVGVGVAHPLDHVAQLLCRREPPAMTGTIPRRVTHSVSVSPSLRTTVKGSRSARRRLQKPTLRYVSADSAPVSATMLSMFRFFKQVIARIALLSTPPPKRVRVSLLDLPSDGFALLPCSASQRRCR